MKTLVPTSSSTHKLIKLLKNAISLFSLGVVDRVANFTFIIVAVRILSRYAFGVYTLIQALLMFGGMIVNFGVELVVVRLVSRDRSQARRLFGAAIVVMLALALPAWADIVALASGSSVGALFPMLSARWGDSRDASRRLYEQSLSFFSVFGFPIASGTTILAVPILRLLFGEVYVAGAVALALLEWTYLFSVIGGPVGSLLVIAADRLGRLILLAGLAALAMSGFLLMFPWMHLLLSVPVGALIYLVTLTALGEFRQQQYHFLRETIDRLAWEKGKRALRRIAN